MHWLNKQQLLGTFVSLAMTLVATPAQAEDLLQVWQYAKAEDVHLAIARANIDLQSQKRDQARAAIMPSVSASVNLSYVDNSVIGKTNFGQSYSLDMKQGLYHRDVILQGQQVEVLIDNSQLGYRFAEQQLLMRVTGAYFDHLAALDALQLAQQEHSATRERHKEISARYEVGVSNVVSLQEAQARLDMMQAQIVLVQSQVVNSREALYEILNRDVDALLALPSNANLTILPQQAISSWVTEAVQNSLPLQQLNKQLQVSSLNIEIQKAVLTPSVDLIAQYSHTNNSQVMYGADVDQYMVGIKASMPIYTGGYAQSKVAEARIQRQQVRRQLEQIQRSITKSVRSSYLAVESAAQLVQAREQVLTSVKLAFKAMESAVDVGTRTNVDLLDIQQQLFSARRDLAQSKYQLILAQLQLKFVAGSLSEVDLKVVNDLLL